ncbi:MAG: hybrid sensor histidine kinase/response regulator, partial [Lachnospiraceae bacterium]|nr:hybrid sensor histidine kinase/response regulator [Lachnospiraceae bacterium]
MSAKSPAALQAKAAGDVFGKNGGGYAATGQLEGVGYTTVLYDADNGLPTSDANCVLSASDGYIWLGGYGGILKCNGTSFERLDSSHGLSNGRILFEDSKGRVWVGTNDNGIVVIGQDGYETQLTYKDGLPASQVRGFGEDNHGTVYAGTSNGVAVISENLEVSVFEAEGITGQYITELNSDSHGNIYGVTRNGSVFSITQGNLAVIVNASDLGGVVTAVFADPENPGKVYLGFATGELFHGILGAPVSAFEKISIAPLEGAEFITYACGRVWVLSLTKAGYLDKNGHIHVLDKLPLDNSLESMTEDYQGNLWFTS